MLYWIVGIFATVFVVWKIVTCIPLMIVLGILAYINAALRTRCVS